MTDRANWSILRPSKAEFSNTTSVLSAADELTACSEANAMLRLAVELARERLGLERVGLYVRDRGADRVVMRGMWGTGARGETTDERSLFHEVSPQQYDALLQARRAGRLGVYQARAPLIASEHGRTFSMGDGWIMATPLLAAGDMVGVMYNDSALTRAPVDEGKQTAAAAFCTLLAALLLSKRGTLAWQPSLRKSGRSPLVRRILCALDDESATTGDQLARELGVSAGHLARSFKREMAMSLVEYRNRIRMDRFFEAIYREGNRDNILVCALQAGFGSYAQFHRVYRMLHRSSPRDIFSTRASGYTPALPTNGHDARPVLVNAP